MSGPAVLVPLSVQPVDSCLAELESCVQAEELSAKVMALEAERDALEYVKAEAQDTLARLESQLATTCRELERAKSTGTPKVGDACWGWDLPALPKGGGEHLSWCCWHAAMTYPAC